MPVVRRRQEKMKDFGRDFAVSRFWLRSSDNEFKAVGSALGGVTPLAGETFCSLGGLDPPLR